MAIRPAVGALRGEPALYACCDRIAPADSTEGHLACLHGLRLGDLLRQARSGFRLWLVAHGDCDACPRGQGPRIDAELAAMTRALGMADSHAIRWKRVTAEQWAALMRARATTALDPNRRGFLSSLGRSARLPERVPGQDGEAPEGELMPIGANALPWVLGMDDRRCTGCQACARACPQGAIDLVDHEGRSSYRLLHEKCNGCGICMDLCQEQAIRVKRWARPEQTIMLMQVARCRRCGVEYRRPAQDEARECWICRRDPGQRRLYQVMA